MTGFDLTESIAPRSDQTNAEDFLSGPRTVTITDVRKGSVEQPVDIHLAEFPGRPFKPSKTVRRILVSAWGPDASTYAGRRMTLYRDEKVRFGGMDVGGIRVSHLSHIAKPMTLVLAVSKGKRAPYVVQPLADEPAKPTFPREHFIDRARKAKTLAVWREVWQDAKSAGVLDDAMKAELQPLGEALKTEPPVDSPPVEEPPAEPTLDGWPAVTPAGGAK